MDLKATDNEIDWQLNKWIKFQAETGAPVVARSSFIDALEDQHTRTLTQERETREDAENHIKKLKANSIVATNLTKRYKVRVEKAEQKSDEWRTLVVRLTEELHQAKAEWHEEKKRALEADQELKNSAGHIKNLKAELVIAWDQRDQADEKLEKLKVVVSTLFDKIAHGDDAHRAWLKTALDEHFANKGS